MTMTIPPDCRPARQARGRLTDAVLLQMASLVLVRARDALAGSVRVPTGRPGKTRRLNRKERDAFILAEIEAVLAELEYRQ